MINSMDKIVVKYHGNKSVLEEKELQLPKFLQLKRKELNPFEYSVLSVLNEIYSLNKENALYSQFPIRKKPLVIDLVSSRIPTGWTAVYGPKRNSIRISRDLKKEDFKITLMHELKHAEQWFNDSKFNNYQRHQAFCLLEVYAKLFIGSVIGKGAYFNISLTEAIDKWFAKHYPNYKAKYDQQWPLKENLVGLEHLPKSFKLSLQEEKEIIKMLNKNVLKQNNEFKVRAVELADAEVIAKINTLCWKTAYRGIIEDRFLDELSITPKRLERFRDGIKNKQIYFCAVKEGKVVGYLNGGKTKDENLPYPYEVYCLYVHPDFQRHGIGHILIDAFKKEINNQPFCIYMLDGNKNGLNFYQKMGGIRQPQYDTDSEVMKLKMHDVCFAFNVK